MGGSSKKKHKRLWYEYQISFHLGFCAGPVDCLTEVIFKDRQAWKGELWGNSTTKLKKKDLFGGDEREGGINGLMFNMNGAWDQVAPAEYAARFGRTPANMPAYRGIASLIFLGNDRSSGFMVGANMPDVPQVSARWRRIPVRLPSSYSSIKNPKGYVDANPAHIIFDALTDDLWGMDASVSQIDVPSFVQAAETLNAENFGLSFHWVKQSAIESFVQEVLDHINAVLFFNPRLGKVSLRLLRNDYDPQGLIELGPDNAVLKTFQRKLWGETVNEVVVTWTNPENEESETVTNSDPANIAMQGQVVSENHNYYGIRSQDLANRVAARDIVMASSPLASAEIEVNRRSWDLTIGDVISFSWPKYQIEKLPMRIMDINEGKFEDSKITLSLLEDVFGIPYAEYIYPTTPPPPKPPSQGGGDDNGNQTSNPDMAKSDNMFIALSYPLIITNVADSTGMTDEAYPQIIDAAIVSTTNPNVVSFLLSESDVMPDGSESWVTSSDMNLTTKSTLMNTLSLEVESDLYVNPLNTFGTFRPQVGDLIYIGLQLNEGKGKGRREFLAEMVLVTEELDNNGYRVLRGIHDTVPHIWPAGTILHFITQDFDSVDGTPEFADTNSEYKIQLRTFVGISDIDKVPLITTNRPARPYMPFRPANVRIDNRLFEDYDQRRNYNPRNWSILFSWSTRNRTTEDTIYTKWNDTTVNPEPNQTTSICTDYNTSNEKRIRNLTAEQYVVDVFKTGRMETYHLKFIAERKFGEDHSLDSLQGIEPTAYLYKKGFGSDWGFFYGGWPDEDIFE